ncbi:VPEID-CTERM sorting domain-containing protein [Meridianimarinicoccus roseus]|jgi:hypothetical protein|uniref:VPEID-CTERM sorting domain-containing protein n=1 Tax=Meridianimarinicoccus roseus TaxID=2072018 RepID=A0A2V2LBH3_9RHOB|nr:VPEID-CTERM sorting domain-containing protein [Meridianimarinicoccus roseus]PWR02542.1 VPEID-CTERM sorting domain-containing protein [Meridianimarinicoccus roseus]
MKKVLTIAAITVIASASGALASTCPPICPTVPEIDAAAGVAALAAVGAGVALLRERFKR